MNNFLNMIWESSIVLLMLYGIYFLLRNKLSYGYRRRVLIGLPLLSVLTVSLKSLLLKSGMVYSMAVIELQPVEVSATHSAESEVTFTWTQIYYAGIAVVIALFIYKVIRILYFFRDAKKNESSLNIRTKISEGHESFSFFNFIHLSADLNEEERKVVYEHELLHSKKNHSFELVLMELYQALFWFNPILILMKKELVEIHEFEVDREMYAEHGSKYWELLLGYSLGTSSAQFLLTSQFYNKLTLAKRIKKMKSSLNNKKRLALIIPLFAIGFSLVSLTSMHSDPMSTNSVGHYGDGKIYDEVDKMPEFKGGQEALFSFIGENVKYPKTAEKKGVEGTVYVEYVIDTDGAVTDVTLKKSSEHAELDNEAIRVVKLMPNWTPGENEGKKVKVRMVLPIAFKL